MRHAAEIRRFVGRLALVLSPFVLLILSSELLLAASRETWTAPQVIEYQSAHQRVLYSRKFLDEQMQEYKVDLLLAHPRRIAAVGSSRVMQFRGWMFGPDSSDFINLGGMIQSLDDLEVMADSAPASTLPRMVILGVDIRWLNGNSHDLGQLSLVRSRSLGWQDHLRAARAFVTRPRVVISAMQRLAAGRQDIGIRALVDSSGFRRDGSFRWPYKVPGSTQWAYRDRLEPTAVERIRGGMQGFEHSNGVDSVRLAQLARILDTLQRRGVHVAGFIPPLAHPVIEELERDPGDRGLYEQFVPAVTRVFGARGLPLVDGSITERLGLDDRAMGDGYHAMEMLHVVVLAKLLENPDVQRMLRVSRQWLLSRLQDDGTNHWYVGGR